MTTPIVPYGDVFTIFGNMNSSFKKDLRERKHDNAPIGPHEEEHWEM